MGTGLLFLPLFRSLSLPRNSHGIRCSVTCTGDCEEANAANAEQNCGALPQRKLQVRMLAGRPVDAWTGSAPRHASPDQRKSLCSMARGFFPDTPAVPFGDDDYTSMYRMKVVVLGHN
jgi:hypothetical protein